MAADEACPSCPRCRAGICEIHGPAVGRREIAVFALSGVLLLLGILVGSFTPYPLAGTALLIAAAVISGYDVLKTGLLALIRLRFSIAVLISIAAAGAFLTANPAEGATVLYLYAIAEFLEEYAAGRAHRSIASLLDIAPQMARVRRDGEEVTVGVGEVGVGDRDRETGRYHRARRRRHGRRVLRRPGGDHRGERPGAKEHRRRGLRRDPERRGLP